MKEPRWWSELAAGLGLLLILWGAYYAAVYYLYVKTTP